MQLGVDKLWKTWDTYALTTLASLLIHRMVLTTQSDPVPLDARTGARQRQIRDNLAPYLVGPVSRPGCPPRGPQVSEEPSAVRSCSTRGGRASSLVA